MARSNGGPEWEREFAKRLSLWWTGGQNPDVFWRSIGSGGRSTRRKGTKLHHGDIALIDPIGKPLMDLVVIELKKGYRSATIHDLLDRPERAKEQTYEEWFHKAETCRKAAGAYAWLVVHMRKRREAVVWMSRMLYQHLVKAGGFIGGDVPIISYGTPGLVGGCSCIQGMLLSSFFEKVSHEHVLNVLEEVR